MISLQAEEITVSRRQISGDTVRVSTITREVELPVEEALTHERVEVRRVAVGRQVDSWPLIREEGDTTILPVVEEVVVVERRLILKEEIHVRRVRTTEVHREAVTVREQVALVTRVAPELPAGRHERLQTPTHTTFQEQQNMSGQASKTGEETIVAVYDRAADADAAIASLISEGFGERDIVRHVEASSDTLATPGTQGATQSPPRKEAGFWANLFGIDPREDSSVYEHGVSAGAVIVTVRVRDPARDASRALETLEKHNPIDLDERAGTLTTMSTPVAARSPAPLGSSMPGAMTAASDPGTMQLSEETLAVGKRAVAGGTTRVRRYVVETPVEQQVTLHTEKVTLERRPVTDGRPVTADFADKTIEMTETSEEAVVSKTARVTEEISLRKDASERVETVKDIVRRDEVEIEQVPGREVDASRTAAKVPVTPPPVRPI